MKPQLIAEIENGLKELDMEERTGLLYYLIGYCEADLEHGNTKRTEDLMNALLKRIKEIQG